MKSGAVAGLLLFGSFGAQGEGHPVDIEIGSSIMKNEEAPPINDLLMNEEVLRMDENTNQCDARKRKHEERANGRKWDTSLCAIIGLSPVHHLSTVFLKSVQVLLYKPNV